VASFWNKLWKSEQLIRIVKLFALLKMYYNDAVVCGTARIKFQECFLFYR